MNEQATVQEGIIVSTVEKLSQKQRRIIWALDDFLAFVFGAFFGYLILYQVISPSVLIIATNLFVGFILFIVIGYKTMVRGHINRYLNLNDLSRLFMLSTLSKLIADIVTFFIFKWISTRFSIISIVSTGALIIASRILWQQLYISRKTHSIKNKPDNYKKVVLIGAGDGGSYFLESYRRHPGKFNIVGILDKDPSKHNQVIAGVKVLGDRQLLPRLKNEGVEEVIITIPSLAAQEYENLLKLCNALDLKVHKMPKIEDVIQGLVKPSDHLPKVNISDLLGRKEIRLDETRLRTELENKTILVTGAGGSIGSEIVRQVSRFNPRRVLLLGHGENSIYLIYHEMLKLGRMTEYVPVIADIQDRERIREILTKERPDIVYHAAAHKHVPLMEMNPVEAYKNNIIGTYHLAKAVDEIGIQKMVMISSDKAVNPPNVMGASKRVAELIVTGIAKESQSTFCAVRFGNVLGSRGSVIPVFEKQIAEGGPVTVTDLRMTRYFMTIPEASRLVIHAGAFAENGEVFVLDMGEPVKIIDLAKKLILLSGYEEHEIAIVETGIRPGEKLYEELLLSSEHCDRQVDEKIFIGNVAVKPLEEIEDFIDSLYKVEHHLLKEKIIAFANDNGE